MSRGRAAGTSIPHYEEGCRAVAMGWITRRPDSIYDELVELMHKHMR